MHMSVGQGFQPKTRWLFEAMVGIAGKLASSWSLLEAKSEVAHET